MDRNTSDIIDIQERLEKLDNIVAKLLEVNGLEICKDCRSMGMDEDGYFCNTCEAEGFLDKGEKS